MKDRRSKKKLFSNESWLSIRSYTIKTSQYLFNSLHQFVSLSEFLLFCTGFGFSTCAIDLGDVGFKRNWKTVGFIQFLGLKKHAAMPSYSAFFLHVLVKDRRSKKNSFSTNLGSKIRVHEVPLFIPPSQGFWADLKPTPFSRNCCEEEELEVFRMKNGQSWLNKKGRKGEVYQTKLFWGCHFVLMQPRKTFRKGCLFVVCLFLWG